MMAKASKNSESNSVSWLCGLLEPYQRGHVYDGFGEPNAMSCLLIEGCLSRYPTGRPGLNIRSQLLIISDYSDSNCVEENI